MNSIIFICAWQYICVCYRYTQWWDSCALKYLPYSCDDGQM